MESKMRVSTAYIRMAVVAAAVLSGAAACRDGQPKEPSTLIADAASYLWSQQSEDGGWHSAAHGIARSGQAWTPFVLFHLLQVPADVLPAPEGAVDLGLAFIRARLNDNGALGLADPVIVEYPNYATAYAILALAEAGRESDSTLIAEMRQYLAGQQFTESRGIGPDHLAYGSWGFGETTLAPGTVGHVDLSHTRRVVQALAASGTGGATQGFAQTQSFLRLLQRHPDEMRTQPLYDPGDPSHVPYDGGFYASATALGTNKGPQVEATKDHGAHFSSYATATCDGLLSLLATGASPSDEPVQKAAQWLLENDDLSWPAGIPRADPTGWGGAMWYYHIAARAESYRALDVAGNWRKRVVDLLEAEQFEDGRFVNQAGVLNKEDDPLIATTLALQALLAARDI